MPKTDKLQKLSASRAGVEKCYGISFAENETLSGLWCDKFALVHDGKASRVEFVGQFVVER